LSLLPSLIGKAYTSAYAFFFVETRIYSPWVVYAFIAALAMSLLLLAILVIQKGIAKKRTHFVLLLVLIGMYPLACNLIHVMNPEFVYLNMVYALVFLPVAAVGLMDITQAEEKPHHKDRIASFIKRGACWVASIALAACVYHDGIFANKAYTVSAVGYQQGVAFSVELATRIKILDEYDDELPILLVGTVASRAATTNRDPRIAEGFNIVGLIHNIPSNYCFGDFLHNFIGLRSGPIIEVGNAEVLESFHLGPAFEEMPVYPKEGSIKAIDRYIVIKFGDL